MRFQSIERTNLLQSYEYALSATAVNFQKPRFGLIFIDDKEAGIVTLLEASILWNLFHAMILDRGPLWFEGFGGAAHIKAFFDRLNTEFPARFGRKRRILPEIENGATACKIIEQCGFQRLERKGYQTIWLDLEKGSEDLEAGFKKNWRNALSKSKRENLSLEWDETGKSLPWLLKMHEQDRKQKNYDGASAALMTSLGRNFSKSGGLLIGKAKKEGETVAAILIFTHGRSATYQIGWIRDCGRKSCAHHFLLGHAISMLKEKKVKTLDLGGINDEGAKGVKEFKEGLGGENICLIGHYV